MRIYFILFILCVSCLPQKGNENQSSPSEKIDYKMIDKAELEPCPEDGNLTDYVKECQVKLDGNVIQCTPQKNADNCSEIFKDPCMQFKSKLEFKNQLVEIYFNSVRVYNQVCRQL